MDVREAVGAAKDYVARVFAEEDIGSIGLEEVEFDYDSNVWKITVSFTRPGDRQDPFKALAPSRTGGKQVRYSYKIVNIDDDSGKVISLKHRVLAAAD